MNEFHLEPLLAGAYILSLMLIALVLEWMARASHKRADQYHTGGFRFHRDRDAWECPTGMALERAEVDHELRIIRYRAPAHTCNYCPIKSRCTSSNRGREIAVPMDPWVKSASLRFQTGISFVLLVLAGFIAVVELLRHGHGAEAWVMGTLLAAILAMGRSVFLRLRPATSDTNNGYMSFSQTWGGK
jgi:hypothetical protein